MTKTFLSKVAALAMFAAATLLGGATPATAQVSHDLVLEFDFRVEEPTSKVVTEMSICTLGTCAVVDHTEFDISARDDESSLEYEVEVCKKKSEWADICSVYDCEEDHVNQWSICNLKSRYNKSCYNETCSGT